MMKVRIFLQQAWLNYKAGHAQIDAEELIFYRVAIPLITLVYYCVIAEYSFQTDRLAAWVIGNSLLLCNTTCVFDLGTAFSSDRYSGRLKWLIASPYSRVAAVFERGLFSVLEGFATVALGLAFGSLVFGISFAGVDLALFVLTVLIGVFAAMCFGLFLSVFALLGDGMHLLLNLVNVSLLILCGANFPVAALPPLVQRLSYCLPFTRSIEAGNLLFGTQSGGAFFPLLAQEALVGLAYLVAGILLLKAIEKIAVKKATLELF